MIDLPLLQTRYPCTGGQSRPLLWFGMFAIAWVLATWVAPRFRKKGSTAMKTMWKVVLVVALAGAVVAVIAIKERNKDALPPATADIAAAPTEMTLEAGQPVEPSGALPRLVELPSLL